MQSSDDALDGDIIGGALESSRNRSAPKLVAAARAMAGRVRVNNHLGVSMAVRSIGNRGAEGKR